MKDQIKSFFESQGYVIELLKMDDDVKTWENMRVHDEKGKYLGTLFFIGNQMVSSSYLDSLVDKPIEVTESDLREMDMVYFVEYIGHIKESARNGQYKQARDLINKMSKSQMLTAIENFDSNSRIDCLLRSAIIDSAVNGPSNR